MFLLLYYFQQTLCLVHLHKLMRLNLTAICSSIHQIYLPPSAVARGLKTIATLDKRWNTHWTVLPGLISTNKPSLTSWTFYSLHFMLSGMRVKVVLDIELGGRHASHDSIMLVRATTYEYIFFFREVSFLKNGRTSFQCTPFTFFTPIAFTFQRPW